MTKKCYWLLAFNSELGSSSFVKIYSLNDSTDLKHIVTTADTFVVLQRPAYSSLVYAVEPILNNTISAARSTSLNLNLQGVQCFYKTLNYHLLDENKLNLLLELSVTSYVDSIFFEKVTASGQLLQTYGSAKAGGGTLVYSQLVDDISGGITYLRARIKLKNGATVYTDIITVLTSGQKTIWFYPNPAVKNTVLSYVLRQGTPTSSKLQFFDATGRLLKNYGSMPDKIDLSGFAAGLVIYKLLDEDSNVLETGKLVITN